jgi:hypothetical protein
MISRTPEGPSEAAREYLATRGVSVETAVANGVEFYGRLLPAHYKLRLNMDQWGGKPIHELLTDSIWFRCADSKTELQSLIVRPFPPLPSENGKDAPKFLTPRKGKTYPFIPPATWQVAAKPNKPLLITEGPVKALAALQAGAYPIGANGVWLTVTRDKEKDTTALHEAFTEFTLAGRTVYLAFDADFASNPSVRQALIRTAVLLHKASAEVKVLTWPLTAGKGLDDYLVRLSNGSQSSGQVLTDLCEKAGTLGSILRDCDSEFFEFEVVRARVKGVKLSQLCRQVNKALKAPVEAIEQGILQAYEQAEQEAKAQALEPWTEAVDGAQLANEIVAALRSHIAFDAFQAEAVTLWIFLTYLEEVVDTLPLLIINSPVKRCGKTTLLELLSDLVNNPEPSSNMSGPSIYRIIEK